MLKTVNFKVKCKCGETGLSILPDGHGRVDLPNYQCFQCGESCTIKKSGNRPKGKK